MLGDGTDADVIALAEDPLEVAVQIFYVRGGRIRGQRGWVADRVDEGGTAELVEDFLLQLYAGDSDTIPREILVPALPPDAATFEQLFSDLRGSKVSVRVPQRGDKRALQETVARNAGQSLALHKTKRASDLTTRNRALEEIQEALGLDEVPLRIECYDVSNLQGTEVVASMVVFEDGLARKSEYRRFVIKGVDGQNDVASMHEVITRRFRRLLDEQARSDTVSDRRGPDAGRPRDRAAAQVRLRARPGRRRRRPAAGRRRPAGPRRARHRRHPGLRAGQAARGGLAARRGGPGHPGPRSSEGLYLLQRIRDEAHRFAITHHRSRRSKSMVESLLDDVPGLGEVRRKTLLKHFGSLKKLRAATVEEIAQVPGIGAAHRHRHQGCGRAAQRQDCLRQHRHRRDRGELDERPTRFAASSWS